MLMHFENTCVICHEDRLTFRPKIVVLGISLPKCYYCENCGSTFAEDELRWKLVHIKDKHNPVWQEFRERSLYVREWLSIGHLDTKRSMFNALETHLTAFDILGIRA